MATKEKNDQQQIYIVVGVNTYAFWIDRKLGRLMERTIGKNRTTIIGDKEFSFRRRTSKQPFIVIGGPEANNVASEICEMHPDPIHIEYEGGKELFFIQGGIMKNDHGYQVIDLCLLVWGRRIRDTLSAVKYCLSGEGQKVMAAFVNCDWSQVPVSKESKWKTKYWDNISTLDKN